MKKPDPFPFAKRVPPVAQTGAAQATSSSHVIPLSYGTPTSDAFPYESLVEAATASILREGRDSLQYAGAGGPRSVQEWIAKRSSLRSIHVQADQVLVTYGSQQAIDFAARTLLEPGDHVWVEAPTYFGAVGIFRTSEAVLTSFPMDGDGLRVELIEVALYHARQSGLPLPKLLYCLPNFHNPGGISLSLERRKRLAELAYEFNFFILEDDAYTELTFTEERLPSLYSLAPERTIYLSTFSKIIAPGIRLGWAIAAKEVVARLNSFMHGSRASVFAQEIVSQLLHTIDFDEHVQALISRYRKSRDAMIEAINDSFGTEVAYHVPEGGFFIWLTFPEEVDTAQFVRDAYERGVSFIAGSDFFVEREGGRHARLSYSYSGPEQIRQGVKLFADAYYAYRGKL